MDSTLSSLFATAESGDRAAADQLFAALYDELHRMARRELSKRVKQVVIAPLSLWRRCVARLMSAVALGWG